MTIEGPALTALFLGMAWALIRVVEFFITKYKKTKEPRPGLTEKQDQCLEEARDYSKNLFEMHNVYDEGRTPLWVVPPELTKLIRENHNYLETLIKELDDNLDDIKGGQSVVVDKMTDLISSNKLMTERLGDLISALRKFPNGGSK